MSKNLSLLHAPRLRFFPMLLASSGQTSSLVRANRILIMVFLVAFWDVTHASSEWWKADWKYRHLLALEADGPELRGFPALVVLDSARIDYAAMQSKGKDLRFVDAQGQVSPYEIEEWNPAGLSYIWVRVHRLAATPNHIWLYYGNPAAVGEQRPEPVWDSGFRGVWHLGEGPLGPSPQMKDSTSNQNHGSTQGGTAATARVSGKIGYCLQFDGKEGFLKHPHAPSLILDRLTPFTLEAWIRTSEPVNQSILAKQNLEFRGYHLLLDNRPDPANPFVLRLVMPAVPARNEIKVIGAQPLTDGQWHYVVASYDGSGKATGVKLYVDGKPEKSEIVYDSLRDSLDVD
ncbi:MAG: DUF2341 domain-containing protein, partial [Acidobacteria bacterium]|nr:DUF2341 domain-containing protein [Acidobacteriota bacterium]